MNAEQKAKLAMYESVLDFLGKNMSVVNSNPALKESYTSLANLVTLIKDTVRKEEERLAEDTEKKNILRGKNSRK
jgi:hypothetical protein